MRAFCLRNAKKNSYQVFFEDLNFICKDTEVNGIWILFSNRCKNFRVDLVGVEITLVRVVITLVSVKITLCV
jgi:hypothetical protein